MSMFALLSTWWWRARVREEKGGRERRTLSPLSRRVTASACYNFLLSLHCHDARSFFFSFLYHQIRLMDHPIQYTRVSRGTWFHNFPILLAKGFFAKGAQKSVQLETRIIRKDIFLFSLFFPRTFSNDSTLFMSFVDKGRIVPMFNSGSGLADETVESMVGMLGLRWCGNWATW